MYQIKRENGRVVITKGADTTPILNAAEESYVVYLESGHPTAVKIKDLPDKDLLLALARAVELKV